MYCLVVIYPSFFFFKQKTAYEMRISDWSSDVCSSDLNSSQVGLLSALGSACWYIGFAAAPAALVRIVGQVEVVFTLGFAHFYLREPVRWHEIAGLLLVVGGVVMALIATFCTTLVRLFKSVRSELVDAPSFFSIGRASCRERVCPYV